MKPRALSEKNREADLPYEKKKKNREKEREVSFRGVFKRSPWGKHMSDPKRSEKTERFHQGFSRGEQGTFYTGRGTTFFRALE